MFLVIPVIAMSVILWYVLKPEREATKLRKQGKLPPKIAQQMNQDILEAGLICLVGSQIGPNKK